VGMNSDLHGGYLACIPPFTKPVPARPHPFCPCARTTRRLHCFHSHCSEPLMSWTLSQRAQKLTSSAIREILKVTERPEVISFAGGLPSPDTFPVERLRLHTERVLTDNPTSALQYGPTEGYMALREWIAARYGASPANVLVTTG